MSILKLGGVIQTMLVDVTQEDIDYGVPGSCTRGVIPRAINRAVSAGHPPVMVWRSAKGQAHAVLGSGKFVNLPAEMADFMKRFDELRPVEPASFIIPLDSY